MNPFRPDPVPVRPAQAFCGCLAWVLAVAAAFVCLVQALVPADFDSLFPLPQLVAFGPWFGLLAAIAAVCGVWGRRRAAVAVALACVVYQGFWCVGYWLPDKGFGGDAPAASARVMTLNCYFGGADAREIVETVDREGVQVLCLQEVTPTLYDELEAAGLSERLPYWCGQITGNQIWSAVPLEHAANDAVGYSGSLMPAATVDLGWGPVRVVSVHTCAPVPGLERYWDESLYKLARLRPSDSANAVPYLLMGDFNATIEHASFQAILASGFTDGAQAAGEGLVFTWPVNTGCPVPLVAIDHMLLDDGLRAGEFVYATVAGTDHRAVLATVWGTAATE